VEQICILSIMGRLHKRGTTFDASKENMRTSQCNTTILGAAKFGGKTKMYGWTVGVLESITKRVCRGEL
jgi:hypothetical protein